MCASYKCEVEADYVAGKHRDLQRLTVPYARLLGVTNGREEDQAMVMDL